MSRYFLEKRFNTIGRRIIYGKIGEELVPRVTNNTNAYILPFYENKRAFTDGAYKIAFTKDEINEMLDILISHNITAVPLD